MTTESGFIQEICEIYRLKVPFEDLYTSVFLLRIGGENTLIDCAFADDDADSIIEPALGCLGLKFSDIARVIVTHEHGDHAGGLARMLQKNPKMRVIKTVEKINGLEIYPIPGHTEDFIGVFEQKSGTLISGDGLQGAGIGRYPCELENKEKYLLSIKKIERDKRIKNLLFSHAYEPWNKSAVFGREKVEEVLKYCKNYVFRSYKD